MAIASVIVCYCSTWPTQTNNYLAMSAGDSQWHFYLNDFLMVTIHRFVYCLICANVGVDSRYSHTHFNPGRRFGEGNFWRGRATRQLLVARVFFCVRICSNSTCVMSGGQRDEGTTRHIWLMNFGRVCGWHRSSFCVNGVSRQVFFILNLSSRDALHLSQVCGIRTF